MGQVLSVNELLYAYMGGAFPMGEPDTGDIYWHFPDPRAIIPLDTYKPSKSLRPILNQKRFEVRIDQNFEAVMRACAEPRTAEEQTWITEEIIESYVQLFKAGHAHSVEAYQNNDLVGGLYGVSIGAAFFGESMFHRVSNASKVAFHYLMQILNDQGYRLLDTQYINSNVRRFGAIEIPRSSYLLLLEDALQFSCHFGFLE